MKRYSMLTAATVFAGLISFGAARADTKWDLELGSPIWGCLIRCSSVPADDLSSCLEACGRESDRDAGSADTADKLRCQASLMRAEAAQLSCHATCISASSVDDADEAACTASCDDRYDRKTTLILASPRCEAMQQ